MKRGYDFINLQELTEKSPIEKEYYASCKKQSAWDQVNQTLPEITPTSIYQDDPGFIHFDETLNPKQQDFLAQKFKVKSRAKAT